MLTEDKRQQLDSIISQMVKNQETDNSIQFVVNDFKNRHSTEEPKESFLDKTSNVLDMFFGGKKVGEAISTQVVKLTVPKEQKEFVAPGPTKKEIAGSALQSAALFTPIGRIAKGITAGVRGLGLIKGASAVGKISSGLATGELFDIASNLQQGKSGKEVLTPGLATLISGAIPSAEVAKNVIVRFGERQSPRIINSLIKPLAKDFSYGKNPGRAVSEEGIIANNFDDLIDKIRITRQTIGKGIGELSDNLSTQPILNIQSSLNSLEDAIKIAASQNNNTLLNRLGNVKRAITEVLEPVVDDAGNLSIKSIGSRNFDNLTFKQVRNILSDIGDMTQFTGNPSDDKLVNSALKKVYGKIKETSLKYAENINPNLAKEFSKLTEKYADLHSAEIAAKYRDKIIERHNLIGFSPTTVGVGSALITAVATGGATIPSLLAGISGAIIDKLAATPGFKTRLAYILSKKTQREASYLFRKIPALSAFFSTKDGIFPGDIILGENGEVVSRKIAEFIKKPKIGLSIEDISQNFREAKGMSAKDIMTKYPDIQLKRDVPATDIHGNKVKIPKGEALTPYELKGNKVLLQDGETYIVSKNQYQNIKGNAVSGEAKEFAPELKGTEESIHGGAKSVGSWKQESSGDFNATINGKNLTITKEGSKFYVYEKGGLLGKTVNSLEDAKSTAQMYADQAQQITKFSQYQLPEGKNYKEILIKAPGGFVNESRNQIANRLYDKDFTGLPRTKKMVVEEEFDKGLAKAEATPTFKSSHWDEPNVISHLRLNERTYKGKKVTFMEELQSDWAREGRSKGFATDITKDTAKQQGFNVYKAKSSTGEEAYFIDNITDEFFYRKGFPNTGFDTEAQAWDSIVKKLKETNGAVPNNPLLKKWQELSVKRALKEAVDNNSEYLAWISGEQTSARYNLATHLEDVNWKSAEQGGRKVVELKPKDGSSFDITFDKNGIIDGGSAGAVRDGSWKGKKLDEVLGKGLADKIMEKETGQLSGEGLAFGGEWAKNLYDKQVKNIVEDITGHKVEVIDMGLPIEKAQAEFKILTRPGGGISRKLEIADLKTGNEIIKGGDKYIITDILGDGKFKAVPKAEYGYFDIKNKDKAWFQKDKVKRQERLDRKKETFDISTKKSAGQQAIKITPKIKALVKGEALKLK